MIRQERKVISGLAPLIRPYSLRMSGLVVLRLLESLAEGIGISLFIPLFANLEGSELSTGTGQWLGEIFERVYSVFPPEKRLGMVALSIFALAVARSGLGYLTSIMFSRIDTEANHDLRNRVIQQLSSVGVRELQRREPGKLLTTLETLTAETSKAFWCVFGLILNFWTIVIFSLFLILLSWKMTLLVVVALAVISVILKLVAWRAEELARRHLDTYQEMVQFALELLRGQRTIRIFDRVHYETERFDRVSNRLRERSFDLVRISSLISPLAQLLAAALLLAVLLIFLRSPGDLPSVLVFVFMLYRLHPQVMELDETRYELVTSGPAIEELRQLLETGSKEYVQSGPVAFGGLEQGIRFESVFFRYSTGDPWAIEDLTTEFPKGKTIALVGPSGAGKSTLADLVIRLFDPDIGRIRVDGRALPDLDLSSWRQTLAVASQDTHVFNASVRENIAYGHLDASDEEIVEAAQLADAHDFISALPDGYDTVVGDQGIRLSGGQRQRVALARAIVRQAEILILDEATNALDSISEQNIHRSIRQLGRTRTVIVVAHRLSTIELADHIVVLEDGRVLEQGNARELLANRDLFSRLYELQQTSSWNTGE